jgi:hypothetical protein
MLIDLFGVQRQELTTCKELIVSAELRPISVRSESVGISGSFLTTGQVTAGKLTLNTLRDCRDFTSTIYFDESKPVIFDECLDDWLASLSNQTDSAAVKVINTESWQIGMVSATPTRSEPNRMAWRLQMGDGIRSATTVLDPQGVAVERIYQNPSTHLKRCTAKEAEDIDYRTWSGRELLTFPLDQKISAPHRLRSLTVELTWRDIPFEEFELEDVRQQVIAESECDGHYNAVLRISAPPAITNDVAFPFKGRDFESCLSETRFIKPKDQGILDAAQEIVKGQQTALGAVQSLSAWVNGFIEGSLIAETLSGPQVLARRTGKCSEYSTLFASLARSVGIPTRIALGERLVGDQWMGHMWNEAYIGQWMPVDASANEVGESHALLKFIHSDTLNGTQPLRWKLTHSLDIAILDFELRPSRLSERYQTGIDGLVYTNVDYGCRLTAPVETWTIEDKSSGGHATIRFHVPDEDEVLIHFVVFPAAPGTEPKTLTTARLKMLRSRYGDFEVMRDEPCKVQGAKGHRTCFGGSNENTDEEFWTTEVVWTHSSVGYLLNLIAPRPKHEEHLLDFEALLGGFEPLSDLED